LSFVHHTFSKSCPKQAKRSTCSPSRLSPNQHRAALYVRGRPVFQFFFPRYLLHSLMRRLCAGVSSNHFENCEWHQRLFCSKSSTKQPDGLSSAYQRCIKPFFRPTDFFPPTTQLPGCISKNTGMQLICVRLSLSSKIKRSYSICALCLRLSSRNVKEICDM
jgi:hypothetical protein